MDAHEMHETDAEAAGAHPAGMPGRPDEQRTRRNGMILADGAGGVLALDLTCRDMRWLAEACRQLAEGSEPRWARMLKVQCADTVYLLVRREPAEGEAEVEIATMTSPRERVRLPIDLARIVAALIERALDTPPKPPRHITATA